MSEKSGELVNPRSLSDGLSSGRPLDLITDQSRQQVQHIHSETSVVVLDTIKMEDEGWQLDNSVEVGNSSQERKHESVTGQDEVRAPYANIVNASMQRSTNGQEYFEGLECDPNKVVVLDKDCVIDNTEKFSRIEFS
ncbi:hypothetical protein V6N13_103289 [Hibiscus sabdariffa]|uniref:Uncharacterized protein n=1 Tax=Hibiscus sabdariffa TaxID=183260 RepID=A0ABR2C547_9ROSI